MMNVQELKTSSKSAGGVPGSMPKANVTSPENTTEVHSATLGLALGSISLITVVMNVLVLYAVKLERKLHTVGNLYIVSLSVADLMVGAAVMPLNIVYLLTDKWILGRPACLFWLSMDYVASTASIFSLFILCVDRYRSVEQPLKYLKYRTKTRAAVMISGAWILSLTWIIPILGWHVFANGGVRDVPPHVCETEFHSVTWFKVLTAIVNFYVPSILMLWFYTKIYKAVREHYQHRELINGSFHSVCDTKLVRCSRLREQQHVYNKKQDREGNHAAAHSSFADNGSFAPSPFPHSSMKNSPHQRGCEQTPELVKGSRSEVVKLRCFPLTIVQEHPGVRKGSRKFVAVRKAKLKEKEPVSQNEELELSGSSDEATFADTVLCKRDSACTAEVESKTEIKSTSSLNYLKYTWKTIRSHSKQNIQGLHLNRERKAAKQLGFIMAAFMLCWIPYFVFFMVIAFCQNCSNHNFHMFTIWLGYINSTLNPFIYPLCNENFKKTFKKIFHIS
ncbi:histamine H1 receptor [Lissotriton helveticus]